MPLKNNLRGKNILISAGPTWVALDAVRVISNTASGETGILLAHVFARAGAQVTLLLGPGWFDAPSFRSGLLTIEGQKRVRVLRFSFFEELALLLDRQLHESLYDCVVHAAAVSDFAPLRVSAGKISSKRAALVVRLVPTPKLIDCIKRISPLTFLVGFKYVPEAADLVLRREAKSLLRQSCADLVVANTLRGNRYRAHVIDALGRVRITFSKKQTMAAGLVAYVGRSLGNA